MSEGRYVNLLHAIIQRGTFIITNDDNLLVDIYEASNNFDLGDNGVMSCVMGGRTNNHAMVIKVLGVLLVTPNL